MQARMKPAAPAPAEVEKEPERADGPDESNRGISGVPVEQVSAAGENAADAEYVERSVKIFSYMGSLPDQYGQTGDFYIDELTNMLYGPKTVAGWPEDGTSAEGLCKRTWIGMTRTRLTPVPPESAFMRYFWTVVRFLLPIKLVKSISSF